MDRRKSLHTPNNEIMEKKQTFFEILIEDLTADLQKDPYYDGFKYIKSKSAFEYKFKGGWYSICFRRWYYPDGSMVVEPSFGVRYDILHKWFEPFDFKEIKVQRFLPTELMTFGLGTEKFDFERDPEEYAKTYKEFRKYIITDSKKAFSILRDLEGYYNYKIVPMMEGKIKPHPTSIFAYLTCVKLVRPDEYPAFKQFILKYIENNIKDPNIEKYEPRLDEMFDYLETHELKV